MSLTYPPTHGTRLQAGNGQILIPQAHARAHAHHAHVHAHFHAHAHARAHALSTAHLTPLDPAQPTAGGLLGLDTPLADIQSHECDVVDLFDLANVPANVSPVDEPFRSGMEMAAPITAATSQFPIHPSGSPAFEDRNIFGFAPSFPGHVEWASAPTSIPPSSPPSQPTSPMSLPPEAASSAQSSIQPSYESLAPICDSGQPPPPQFPRWKSGLPRRDRSVVPKRTPRTRPKLPTPHFEVERKYRRSLVEELDRLRRAIPSLPQHDEPGDGGVKVSKVTVLAAAIKYIKTIEAERNALRRKIDTVYQQDSWEDSGNFIRTTDFAS